MTSSRAARQVARRGVAGGLSAPRRAVAPMSVVVRGYAIPLVRIGLVVLVGVTMGATHLSVHSVAVYKEGMKQGLRTEILRLQRANSQREEVVERTARATREQYEWEGAVRLPVETVTVYQAATGADKRPSASTSYEGRLGGGERGEVEDGWYWRLAGKVKEALSPKRGKRDE